MEWLVAAAVLALGVAGAEVETLRGRHNGGSLVAGATALAAVGAAILQRRHARAARWLGFAAAMGAGATLFALIQRWGA